MAATNNLQARLPLQFAVRCEVCDAPFEIERRKGRPQKFCSDVCRQAQLSAQKAEWQRQRTTEAGGDRKSERSPARTGT
jgi:hypothetical protein